MIKSYYKFNGYVFIQLNTQTKVYQLKSLRGLDCFILGRRYIYKSKEYALYKEIEKIKLELLFKNIDNQLNTLIKGK